MSDSPPPPGSPAAADFRLLFEAAPDLLVVLDATDEHRFVATSDAYMESIMTEREAIIGRPVFEVFPDNMDDASAASHAALRVALGRVRATGVSEVLPIYQYNIRRTEADGGGYEARYWQTSVRPVYPGCAARVGQAARHLRFRVARLTTGSAVPHDSVGAHRKGAEPGDHRRGRMQSRAGVG